MEITLGKNRTRVLFPAMENPMKNALLVAAIFATALPLSAGKSNPADFPLTVQVTASRLVSECDMIITSVECDLHQHLDVVIDGKKYELATDASRGKNVLQLGSYKAKRLTDVPQQDKSTSYEDHVSYQLLFPDGTTRTYDVVGESE
jgi:hypothetical protein